MPCIYYIFNEYLLYEQILALKIRTFQVLSLLHFHITFLNFFFTTRPLPLEQLWPLGSKTENPDSIWLSAFYKTLLSCQYHETVHNKIFCPTVSLFVFHLFSPEQPTSLSSHRIMTQPLYKFQEHLSPPKHLTQVHNVNVFPHPASMRALK